MLQRAYSDESQRPCAVRIGIQCRNLELFSVQNIPLVSVRIPAYNHERFVERCLDSVLEQDYAHLEIIIIDDGSSDATAERISQWIERNRSTVPVTFRSRENRGITRTLNELVSLCKGELIVGLASDDYLLPGSISRRIGYLHLHPEKLAVFADSKVVDEKNQTLFDSSLRELRHARTLNFAADEGLRRETIQRWAVPGSTTMVRSELHQILRFDESLQIEDRDFYLRMVARNWLGFLDAPVVAYRVHGGNFSMQKDVYLHASWAKLQALLRNIGQFEWKDRILFVWAISSACVGLFVWGVLHGIRKLGRKGSSLPQKLVS